MIIYIMYYSHGSQFFLALYSEREFITVVHLVTSFFEMVRDVRYYGPGVFKIHRKQNGRDL